MFQLERVSSQVKKKSIMFHLNNESLGLKAKTLLELNYILGKKCAAKP
jgi:hypothetical protein